FLLQLAMNGLVIGLLYALVTVGLALIYGVLEIVNFAHGELIMLGAFAMAFVLPVMGLLYLPSLAVAVLASGLAGWLLFELFVSALVTGDFEPSIRVPAGVSMILLFGMQYLFTASGRMVETELGLAGISLGAVRTTLSRLVAAGVAVAGFLLLGLILHRTQ